MRGAEGKEKGTFMLVEECTAEIHDGTGYSLGVVYGFKMDKVVKKWYFDDDDKKWIRKTLAQHTWYFDEKLSVCLTPIGRDQFRVDPDYTPFLEWTDYEHTSPVVGQADAEAKVKSLLTHFDLAW